MGISTMIRLACEQLGIEPIYVSSNVPKLKAFLYDASGSPYTVDFRKKLLVIDPLDAVFAESTCASELADFFKTKARIPVVCAGHRLRSSTSKLGSMFPAKLYTMQKIAFPAIEESVARPYIERVAHSFGCTKLPVWNGDIRNAIVAITANLSNVTKNSKCDGTEAVSRVLFDDTLTIRESIRMHEGDVSMIVAGTHENYPRTGQDIETCSRLADAYSIADCMEEVMYSTQRWDLNGVYTGLVTGAPIAYLDKTVGKKHKGIDLSKFGTIWSRGNNQRTKEKALRHIRNAMMEHGMYSSHSLDCIAMIRTAIMDAIKSGRWEKIDPIIKKLPNETILAIMRMWKCGFTQAHYGSLKKRRSIL
jgi:hypothetical protein